MSDTENSETSTDMASPREVTPEQVTSCCNSLCSSTQKACQPTPPQVLPFAGMRINEARNCLRTATQSLHSGWCVQRLCHLTRAYVCAFSAWGVGAMTVPFICSFPSPRNSRQRRTNASQTTSLRRRLSSIARRLSSIQTITFSLQIVLSAI